MTNQHSPSGQKPYAVDCDLSNCESELIHLIRLVQPHACLIACQLPDFSIVQLSDNCETIIGQSSTLLLGKKFFAYREEQAFFKTHIKILAFL